MGRHGPCGTDLGGSVIAALTSDIDTQSHRFKVGDIQGLAQRMQRTSQPHPAAVARDADGRLVLLAGGRRLAAQKRNEGGDHMALVYFCSSWNDFERWMEADSEASVGYDVMATRPTEVVRLYDKLERLLQPGHNDSPFAKLCAYLHHHHGDLRRVRSVRVNYMDADVPAEVRRVALAKLRDVDAGRIKGHTAYNHVKEFADSLTPKKVMPLADQRRRFQALLGILAGVRTGLADITTIHPDLPAEELETYYTALSEARAEMTRMVRRLAAATGRESAE